MEYNKNKIGILVGMLLGDASIDKYGRLELGHSIAQKKYLLYKCDRLKYFFNFHYNERYAGKDKKYLECFARSNTSKYLKLLRRIWYKPNKIINKKMVYKLNEEGLAYWYLDDGSLIFQKDKNGNIEARKGYLNTQGFSYEENVILQKMLKDKFNIIVKIHKDKNYFRLFLNSTELKKLLTIISIYIPEDMYYKKCLRYGKNKCFENLCKKECNTTTCPFNILN